MRKFWIAGCILLGLQGNAVFADLMEGIEATGETGQESVTQTAAEEAAVLPPVWARFETGEAPRANVYRWVHKSVVNLNSQVVSTRGGVNIRKIPLLNTRENPTLVRQATEFPLLGQEGDWYKIDVTRAFEDMSVAKFRIATVATNSSSLALRPSLNSSRSSVREWMAKGSRVQILETHGSWCLVKFETQSGFASCRYLGEIGEEEEYWHRDVTPKEGQALAELSSLREEVHSTGPIDPQKIFTYASKLNKALPTMQLHELSAAVQEIEGQLARLMDLNGSDEERRMAEQAREYREQVFYNIEAHQTEARALLDAGKLDQALVHAQIGAYKTRYSNRENLELLHTVLEAQAQAETDPERRAGLEEQAQFVQRTLGSSIAAPAPEVDFSQSGEEGETGGLPSQNEIDELLTEARRLNDQQKYQEALDLGLSLLDRTEGKSVKVKLFLGVQLQQMAAMPQYAEQSASFRSRSTVYIEEAQEGLQENLDVYPDNLEWQEDIEEILAHEPEVPLEPTAEDRAIDDVIDDVLEKNRIRYYTRGKDRLEALDREIEAKASKVKFYLAQQYVILARVYRGQASRWLEKAVTELDAATALRGQYLQTFTENSLWADRALELRAELAGRLGNRLNEPVGEGEESTDTAVEESTPEETGGNEISITRFEMNALTTLAILEAGALCQEEVLDVAQVVFNRIHSPPFNQSNVSAVVFASGQFEPFFTILGRSNRSRRARIFTSQNESAAFASQRRRGLSRSMALSRIRGVETDLQDVSKMRAARTFVGGRTFFLGANMSFHPDRGDKRRRRGCNHYKIGLSRSDVNRHRRYLERLEEQGPLKVTARGS